MPTNWSNAVGSTNGWGYYSNNEPSTGVYYYTVTPQQTGTQTLRINITTSGDWIILDDPWPEEDLKKRKLTDIIGEPDWVI